MKVYLTTSQWALLCVASTGFTPAPTLVRTVPQSQSRFQASPWDDLEPLEVAAKSWTSSLMTSEDAGRLGSSIVNNAPLLLVPALSLVVGQAVLKRRENIQRNVVQTEMMLNRLKNVYFKPKATEVESTERDLAKLKAQLKSADSLITASFTGASLSSAVSLCVILGAVDVPQLSMPAFGGADYTPPTLLAGQPQQQPESKVVVMIEQSSSPQVVEEASPYNALLSSSPKSVTEDYEVIPEESNDLQQQEATTAVAKVDTSMPESVVEIPKSEDASSNEETPSFMDSLMSKVDAVLDQSAENDAAPEPTKQAPSFMDTLMSKLENVQEPETTTSNSDALFSKTDDEMQPETSGDSSSDATVDRLTAKSETTTTSLEELAQQQSTEAETETPSEQLLATTKTPELAGPEAINNEENNILDEDAPRYEVIPQQQTNEDRMTATAKTEHVDDETIQETMDDSKLLADAEETKLEETTVEPPVIQKKPVPQRMTLLETYGDQVLL